MVDWAREHGEPAEIVALLTAGPPSAAKAWARQHGAPSSVLAHPSHGSADRSSSPAPTPSAPFGSEATKARWVEVDLLDQIGRQLDRQQQDPACHRLLTAELTVDQGFTSRGINVTRRVFLPDGEDAFHKPFGGASSALGASGPLAGSMYQQPLHECASAGLATAMGKPWMDLVPGCVLRELDGELGSLSQGRPGVGGTPPSQIAVGLVDAAALFDALTGQQDRHAFNYLVDDRGRRLALIDHGFAFGVAGDRVRFSAFVTRRNDIGRGGLSVPELAALDRVLASESAFGLAGILQPARVAAVQRRARTMRQTGRLLPTGAL